MLHTLSTAVGAIELLTEITAAGVLLMALDRLAQLIRLTYRAGRAAGTVWFRWGLPALLATADAISWLLAEIDWEEVRQGLLAFVALLITAAQLALPTLINASERLGKAYAAVVVPSAAEPAAAPLAPAVSPLGLIAADLSQQRVTELRKAARAAGMAHLGRRGRKAELIAALVAA